MISVLVILPCASASASDIEVSDNKGVYEIGESYVILNSVYYQISNGFIQYEGKNFRVDGNNVYYTDENNHKVFLAIPLEENKVTNPEMIDELNASIGLVSPTSRAIPSNPVNPPYTANVASGNVTVITPSMNVVISQMYYHSILRLTNIPALKDHRFHIIFSWCDPYGDWYSVVQSQDFFWDNTIEFANSSITRYARFTITDLYNSPATSYTYTMGVTVS